MDPKMTVPEAANFLGVSSQAIVKKLKSKNLLYNKKQNRISFGYATSKEIFNLKIKPFVGATQIVKGGTGKSTLTMNIAVRANLYGLKVLCIDLDQQANLSLLFGIENADECAIMYDLIQDKSKKMRLENNLIEITEGLHLFPSRLENAALDDAILIDGLGIDRVYKKIIDPLKSYYDLILFDCPPALGRSVAAAAHACDKIIAPVIPDRLCLAGLNLLHGMLEEIKESQYGKEIPYEIVYNRFDSRTSLSKDILSYILTHEVFKTKLNGNYIRQSQEYPNSAANRESLYDTYKTNSAKEDIDLLVQDLLCLNKEKKEINEIKLNKVAIGTHKNKRSNTRKTKKENNFIS